MLYFIKFIKKDSKHTAYKASFKICLVDSQNGRLNVFPISIAFSVDPSLMKINFIKIKIKFK